MATATQQRGATVAQRDAPADNGAAVLDQALDSVAAQIDSKASAYVVALADPGLVRVRRAMVMAQAVMALEAALTDKIMGLFMRLMNTPLGFKTDRPNKKNPQTYTVQEVRRALVEGFLAGIYPVNNELNIISYSAYATKNAWKRKVEELDGLTDLYVRPGTCAKTQIGNWVVRVAGDWKLNGQKQQLQNEKGEPGQAFEVIGYDDSTPDFLRGKAEAKAYRAIYQRVTGSAQGLPDVDEAPESTAAAAPSEELLKTDPPGTDQAEPSGQAVADAEPTRAELLEGDLMQQVARSRGGAFALHGIKAQSVKELAPLDQEAHARVCAACEARKPRE